MRNLIIRLLALSTLGPEVAARFAGLLGRRARLRLSQTRPVISRLGLGSKQCSQLTLLLGNEHTDHMPAYLRHAHPTHIRNTFEPEQHWRRHVKLHGELTARAIFRRYPRANNDRLIDPVLTHLRTPGSLNNPTAGAVDRAGELLVTEQSHVAQARPCNVSGPPTKRRRSREAQMY